ncbi:MAG: putative FAD-linked oxidoreductase [Firmicutes bacterium]|nr:putative FAD-linked oxidoreductase [Bacillota bacterium]
MRQDLIDAFSKIVGAEHVLTSEEKLLEYADAATPGSIRQPDAIIEPADTSEVSRVLALANVEKIPVYPRGCGSNLYHTVTPLAGGIIILLKRMNTILEIDTANLAATVEPGVFVADLNNEVQKSGLIFPPDPGTLPTATIGGMVAQNTTSMRSLKYGVTKHYIMGLEIVLADGRILKTGGKNVKDVAGYDLTKLMVGSEGSLGIFTKIIVKLMPAPETKKCLLATFKNLGEAGKAVENIIGNKLVPSVLELLDATTIQALGNNALPGLPTDTAAVLLIEIDGIQTVVENDTAKIIEILQTHNAGHIAAAQTEEECNALWAARRAILPSLAKQNSMMWLTDVLIPRSKIADMASAITSIAAKNNLTIATFGHVGDGALHPTIVCNAADRNETSRVANAINAISALTLTLGGKFSSKFQKDQSGQAETYARQAIKQAFDPNNILNPIHRIKEG